MRSEQAARGLIQLGIENLSEQPVPSEWHFATKKIIESGLFYS